MKVRMTAAMMAAMLSAGLAQAAPKASAPLADKLPARVLAYAGWAGRSLTFDGSMIGQLLADPDVDKIVEAIGSAVEQEADDESRPAVCAARKLAAVVWQRPVAAALLDLPKGPEGPEPSAVVLIDVGKDRENFTKHLDALLAAGGDDLASTEATLAATRFRVIRQQGRPDVSFGFIGDLFFLGIGPEAARAVIEKAQASKLSADKKFADCLDAVADGEAQFAYYLDVTGLVARLEQFAAAPGNGGGQADKDDPVAATRRLARAVGLDKVTAAAGATVIVDRGLYTRSRIFSPAPHRGLLLPLAGAEVTDADLAGVPADADFLLAAKVAPQAALDELRRGVGLMDPEADKALAASLTELDKTLGVSLSKDVLANLGDGWVLSSAASRGGFLTGTTLSVSVKDPAKLSRAIARIEAAVMPPKPVGPPAPATRGAKPAPGRRPYAGPRIETIRFARSEIHYLALPSRYSPMPFAPAWAVHDKRLIVAPWPQVIQSSVAEATKAQGVAQTPEFREARRRIAGKPSILLYCNGPRFARELYHSGLLLWTVLANQLAAEDLPDARPHWLPPLSTVEQYLRPSIVAVCPDGAGITVESYGLLPSAAGASGLFLNPATIWLALPARERVRHVHERF